MQNGSFAIINREIKEVLAEMGDLVSAQYDDPDELEQNNETFLELFDRLVELNPLSK